MRASTQHADDLVALKHLGAAFYKYAHYEPDDTALSDERVGRILYLDVVAKAGESVGAASGALDRHGSGTLDVAAYWNHIDPRGMEGFRSEEVLAEISHAIGAAEAALRRAQREERTLTARCARVLRWPRDLADAVGGTTAQRAAARTAGYTGQVAAGLTVAILLWGLARLASLLPSGLGG